MKRIINNLALSLVVLIAFSCSEATELSPADTVVGNWEVVEYYVNGQSQGEFNQIFDRFTLEKDGSFILEDQNGIVYAGTWTLGGAEGKTLELAGDDGSTFQFETIFMSYTKMQVVQDVVSVEPLQIRYLLDRRDDTFYGSNNQYP
jgi:hypothetical protein